MGAGGVMNGQYDYEWAKHIFIVTYIFSGP